MEIIPLSLSRKSYQKLIFTFSFIDLLLIIAGGLAHAAKMYTLYSILGIILIISTIFLIRILFKYYNMDLLPIDWHSLINQYELNNSRFLSTNDHLDPAIDLAYELILRSNEYIYIYTGEYNNRFYQTLKPILESKSQNPEFKQFCIISNRQVEDKTVLPSNCLLLEGYTLSDYRHFITTDYGFRYELSDICGEKTDAAFAMNLINAKNVEKNIIDFHAELKNSFEKLLSSGQRMN
jgi:hypothetical protein